jgi:hypothetical protein
MAIRRKQLHHRIKAQAANQIEAMGAAHPAVPAQMVLPLALVTVNPVSSNYVTLAMEDLMPVTTADGAMVPATGPGRWDQLKLAGGGRHG